MLFSVDFYELKLKIIELELLKIIRGLFINNYVYIK